MPITEVLQIGGPWGVALAIVGFMVNAYFNKRKDDREETRLDRESESGIVETTKQALQLARDEMAAKQATLVEERKEHAAEVKDLNRRNVELMLEKNRIEAEFREYRERRGE